MTLNEYQGLAMRTSPDGHDRMLNGCMGLIGESGEVVDIVKKWKFQSGDHAQLPKDKLIEELGDVLWYCAEISTAQMTEMIPAYRAMGIEGNDYEGIIHMEALFLAKLAWKVAEAWLDEDEYTPQPMFTIAFIIDLVGYMLHNYCDCTLEQCMERNIEKLKRRYPDGFDPERSLHREE